MNYIEYKLALCAVPIVAKILRWWSKSIKWDVDYDFKNDRRKIYAILHGHALGLALHGVDKDIYVLSSRSPDGEISARLLESLGYNVIRGSTEDGDPSKGGRFGALRLIKVLKKGGKMALTVDGPKGPYLSVGKGIIFLAQKTGCPILPMYVRFDKAKTLNTWDRFLIPFPFTRGTIEFGKLIYVKEDDDIEEKRKELEEVMRSFVYSDK